MDRAALRAAPLSGERPHEPTPSRLAKAQREGDVPRSAELSAAASFAGGLLALAAVAGPLAASFRAALASAASGRSDVWPAAHGVALAFVPAAGAATAAACAGMLASGGLRPAAVGFKFERCSPVAGLRRMFSREAFVTGMRGTLGLGACALATLPSLAATFLAGPGSPPSIAAVAIAAAWQTLAAAAAIAALLSIGDFALAYRAWRRKLRMSHDELKRDRKEHDGDPLLRSRRSSLHRSLTRASVLAVRRADFVVTNPTHIAVALEYKPPAIAVPCIVVKAVDRAAERVRELARECGIPIVQDVTLARELYATGTAGTGIPAATYVAVAHVVAALQRPPAPS